jgi:hypothetical protein
LLTWVFLCEGREESNFICSSTLQAEALDKKPLSIASVKEEGEKVVIRLENFSARTRVHAACTHFYPSFSIFDFLNEGLIPEPRVFTSPNSPCQYLVGRSLGDEYRYILGKSLSLILFSFFFF